MTQSAPQSYPSCSSCGLALVDMATPCPRCLSDHSGGAPSGGTPTTGALSPSPTSAPGADAGAQATPVAHLEPEERYRVLDTLGRGGMGIVYKVFDQTLEEVIALKVLDPKVAVAPGMVERFKQELKLSRRINHPNVAHMYDMIRWNGHLAITQSFIEGQSLSRIIRRDGPMEIGRAVHYLHDMAMALQAAHDHGVVHRDMKPGNVLIDPSDRAHVLDFGLAQLAGDGGDAKFVMGTPFYMSPEQAYGQHVDHRADIYSLGIVLFQLITGKVPFRADNPRDIIVKHKDEEPPRLRSIKPEAPPELEEVILRCMQKQPDRRFQHAREVYERVDHLKRTRSTANQKPKGVVPPVAVAPGRRGKILYMEPERPLRQKAREYLEGTGVLVVGVNDGVAGVEAAMRERPSLILLELDLPKLPGLEVLRVLKSNKQTEHIPVVVLTSVEAEHEYESARQAGAGAVLCKPLQRDMLKLIVERYLV